MLCSFPAGKTGSTWLNRLRSAKGIPDDAACDLENFLQNARSPNSEMTNQNPEPVPIFDTVKDQDKKLINMMNSVICELFNFGDNCSNSTKVKKSARKQANPKICAFLKNDDDATCNVDLEKHSEKVASRSGDSNSGVDGLKELNERKDEGEVNLPGFSRTEVTVIDTSYEPWKFDKLLYRKKNVWKVRDKKGKSEGMGTKKKKKVSGGVDDDRLGKKQKIEGKEVCGGNCELPLNEVYHQKGKLESPETAADKVREVFKKKQTDMLSEKLEKESSSVILIKSIPINKKNVTSVSKNCPKLKLNKP